MHIVYNFSHISTKFICNTSQDYISQYLRLEIYGIYIYKHFEMEHIQRTISQDLRYINFEINPQDVYYIYFKMHIQHILRLKSRDVWYIPFEIMWFVYHLIICLNHVNLSIVIFLCSLFWCRLWKYWMYPL